MRLLFETTPHSTKEIHYYYYYYSLIIYLFIYYCRYQESCPWPSHLCPVCKMHARLQLW